MRAGKNATLAPSPASGKPPSEARTTNWPAASVRTVIGTAPATACVPTLTATSEVKPETSHGTTPRSKNPAVYDKQSSYATSTLLRCPSMRSTTLVPPAARSMLESVIVLPKTSLGCRCTVWANPASAAVKKPSSSDVPTSIDRGVTVTENGLPAISSPPEETEMEYSPLTVAFHMPRYSPASCADVSSPEAISALVSALLLLERLMSVVDGRSSARASLPWIALLTALLPWVHPTALGFVLPVYAGTLIALHGLLPHHSAPNRSARSRLAYSLHAVDRGARYLESNWLQRTPDNPATGFAVRGVAA